MGCPEMIHFGNDELSNAQRLIEAALEEDICGIGDLTSEAIIPENHYGSAKFAPRANGALAGGPVVAALVEQSGAGVEWEPLLEEGTVLSKGDEIGRFHGSMRGLLRLERIALNFLQRLSGIATLTQTFVQAVDGLSCQILDTRKTTPGWRILEKYAVRCGGGQNHRIGLFDGIMIKDNHLAALGNGSEEGAITRGVHLARAKHGSSVPLEVEVDNLEQLREALSCGPDMILLDNMSLDQLKEAVGLRNQHAPSVLLEASGGVTLETVRGIAETGVDRISVGALTHSAIALDIGLDYLES